MLAHGVIFRAAFAYNQCCLCTQVTTYELKKKHFKCAKRKCRLSKMKEKKTICVLKQCAQTHQRLLSNCAGCVTGI